MSTDIDPETLRMWMMAVHCCADNVAALRRGDVYRCIGIVHDQGPYETSDEAVTANTKAFVAWLRPQRPDLKDKIDEAVSWIEDENGIVLTETA